MSVKVNGTRVPPGTDDRKWLRQLTSRGASEKRDNGGGYLPPLIVQQRESRSQKADHRPDPRDSRPADPRHDPRQDTRPDLRVRTDRNVARGSTQRVDKVQENQIVQPAAPPPTAPERPRSGKPVQARSTVPAHQSSSSKGSPQYFLVPDKTINAERRVPLLNMNMNPLLSRRISMKQSVPAAISTAVQYVTRSRTALSPPGSPRSPIVPASPRQAAQAGARAVTMGVHRLAAHITGAATAAATVTTSVLSPKANASVPRPPGTDRPNGTRGPSRRYENASSGAQS